MCCWRKSLSSWSACLLPQLLGSYWRSAAFDYPQPVARSGTQAVVLEVQVRRHLMSVIMMSMHLRLMSVVTSPQSGSECAAIAAAADSGRAATNTGPG